MHALAAYSGQLIAGGDFNGSAQHADWVARWDDSSGVWLSLGDGVNDSVNALVVYQGELVAGGWFNMAGGQVVNGIAAWDGKTWHDLGGGMDSVVFDLALYNGELIASGWFGHAGGVEANGIARWNGSIWQPMGKNGDLHGFAEYQGQLYAGGVFDIFRWNGSDWETFGANPQAGQIGPLAVYKGDLIVGGAFAGMNFESAIGIARWNGLTNDWDPLGTGIGVYPNASVDALAVYNGDLIAGGVFTTAGGQSAYSIARWDGSQWHPLGDGFGGGEFPQAAGLIVYDNELIAAGNFTIAGGLPANRIARWQDCKLCIADIVDDHQVNIDDLLAVINSWGPCPDPLPWCAADIASPQPPGGGGVPDGVVDVTDLLWLLNHGWGPCLGGNCLSDINDDGVVAIDDLLILLNTWGACPPLPPPPCPADVAPPATGGDNVVDIDDLLAVINGWGPCP